MSLTVKRPFFAENEQEEGLRLKKKQKSPLKDLEDSLKLKPFKKPSDEVMKPSKEDDAEIILNLFDIIGTHIQTISNGFYKKGYQKNANL